MTTDPVRARWAAGETAFAAWLTLESPAVPRTAVASAGFDAVVIDLQHGHATLRGSPPTCSLRSPRRPALPFVRAAWNHPADLMRALDLGVRGVICPMIGSRAEAEAFVAACRYPPAGTRSYGPIHAAFGRGREQTRAPRTPHPPLRDDRDGRRPREPRRDRVDARARRPVRRAGRPEPRDGPRHLRRPHGPRLARALDSIVAAAGDATTITPGIHAPSPPRTPPRWRRRGFRFVSCAVDEDLLREAAVRCPPRHPLRAAVGSRP